MKKQRATGLLSEPQYRDITVVDPDGWDRSNFEESWSEEIDEGEFQRRLMFSTVLHHPAR